MLTLDAEVALASVDGSVFVPVSEFIKGNRRTTLGPAEMVTGIRIPKPIGAARSDFLKLGARRFLVISIVSAAGLIVSEGDGSVTRAGIAIGACSEVPVRLAALEAAIIGRPLSPDLAKIVTAEHLVDLDPIDDCRATGAYRMDAALTLTRRLLAALGAG